jgi:hypothetical protein
MTQGSIPTELKRNEQLEHLEKQDEVYARYLDELDHQIQLEYKRGEVRPNRGHDHTFKNSGRRMACGSHGGSASLKYKSHSHDDFARVAAIDAQQRLKARSQSRTHNTRGKRILRPYVFLSK